MEPDRWSRLVADPKTVRAEIRRDRITRSLIFAVLCAAVVMVASRRLAARGASRGFTLVFLLAVLVIVVVIFAVIQFRLRRPRRALAAAMDRCHGFYGLALMPVDAGMRSAKSLVFARDGLWLIAPDTQQTVVDHLDVAEIDTITMTIQPRGPGSIAYLQVCREQSTLLDGRCMRLFRRQESVTTFLARLT